MNYGPYVPAPILKRYILAWMSLDPERHTQDLVAARTTVNTRTLYEIIQDKRETVRFNIADHILTGLGYQLAWTEDPELAGFYAAA